MLLLGPLLARTDRRGWRLPAEIFPRGARSRRIFRRWRRWAPSSLDEPGHALDAPSGLTGASFYLDEASVTGTETALLAAAAAKGRSEIRHAAMEPHVVELCRFLRAMGVGDRRRGHIDDPRRSAGAIHAAPTHRLDGDYIEAGSWGVVAAITGGEIEVPARATGTWRSSPRR